LCISLIKLEFRLAKLLVVPPISALTPKIASLTSVPPILEEVFNGKKVWVIIGENFDKMELTKRILELIWTF